MPTDPTPTPTPYPPDTGRTHYDGCWRERGHHNCAVARVDDLAAQLAAARAERDALRERIGTVLEWITRLEEFEGMASQSPETAMHRNLRENLLRGLFDARKGL